MSATITEQPADQSRVFRAGILIACGAATLLWLAGFLPIVTASEPDPFRWIIAFFATPIYAVFAVPAFLLALTGGRASLYVAAVLLLAGASAAGYVFLS